MKNFILALFLLAGVGTCAAGLAQKTSRTSYTSAPAEATACSRRATARSQSECENRCVDKYTTVPYIAECRTRCAASAAMYLAGCMTSGGVLP